MLFIHSSLKKIDYKNSNAETMSTNDQSVFESRHSLIDKPLYSFSKKNSEEPYEPKCQNKGTYSQNQAYLQKNYKTNLEKSCFSLIYFSLFKIFAAK